MYMLDTDICVYALKARNQRLEAALVEHAREICISAICHAELWYGVEHSVHTDRNRAGLEHFLQRLDVQAFGPEAGRHYGDIRQQLTLRGAPIGSNDLLIGRPRAEHGGNLGYQQREGVLTRARSPGRQLGLIATVGHDVMLPNILAPGRLWALDTPPERCSHSRAVLARDTPQ